MPPLHKSLSPQDVYYSVEEHGIGRGKKVPFNASRFNDQDYAVYSQRDVIVGPNPLHDIYLNGEEKQQRGRQRFPGMEWMAEYMNCMCIGTTPYGPDENGIGGSPSRRENVLPPNQNIVYPIAKYAARLNSPYLVEQRRKSISKHLTFRPVHAEDITL